MRLRSIGLAAVLVVSALAFAACDLLVGPGGERARLVFDANGGFGAMDERAGAPGAAAVLPACAFVYPGWEFVGWNTRPDGRGEAYAAGDAFALPAGETSLFAQWRSLPRYALGFVANGGYGTMSAQTRYAGEKFGLVANGFGHATAAFDSWNTAADGSGERYLPGDLFTMPGGPTELYARWNEPPGSTVSFVANGGAGAMDDRRVPAGEWLQIPACAFTNGTAFLGWNERADGQGAWRAVGSYLQPSADLILYAHWAVAETVAYTLNFAADGGSGDTPARTGLAAGASVVLPECGFDKAGWRFAAWVDPDGAERRPGDAFTMPAADATLTARWVSAVYRLSFNANEGEGTMAPLDKAAGDNFQLPAFIFTRLGHQKPLKCWNTRADGQGDAYEDGQGIAMPAADLTLFAIWSVKHYALSFHPNGGAGSMDPLSPAYGDSFALPAAGFSRARYDFAGWNTVDVGGGTAYADRAVFAMGDGPVDLYAQWTEKPWYAVIYRKGTARYELGLAGAAPAEVRYQAGDAINAAANSGGLAKQGYAFAGWNTAADGSGTNYAVGAAFAPPAGGLYLYPEWRAPAGIGGPGQAGGVVFYDKGAYSDGWRYLEAAPADLPADVLGTNGADYPANEALGGGYDQSAYLATDGDGGAACAAYAAGGYDDWYIPNLAELAQLVKYADLIPGLTGAVYHSSSQSTVVDGSTGLPRAAYATFALSVATSESVEAAKGASVMPIRPIRRY
jgi:hypothetical protein